MLSDQILEFKKQVAAIEHANQMFIKSGDCLKVKLHETYVNSDKSNDYDALYDVATAMFYEDDQEVNHVKTAIGIIQVEPNDFPIIGDFNDARDLWKRYIKSIRSKKAKINNEHVSLGKALLEHSGYSRLHRVQMRRQFHIIHGEPLKLSCKFCDNQKIVRFSKSELLDRIESFGDAGKVAKDYVQRSSSTDFALKWKEYQSVKSNVIYLDRNGKKQRKSVAATLPVVFVTERFNEPVVTTAKDRNAMKPRKDRTIQEQVLVTLGDATIHEYIK